MTVVVHLPPRPNGGSLFNPRGGGAHPREGAPWLPEEDRELVRLRRAAMTFGKLCAAVRIVAEDSGRTVAEVCRRFDWLLGPAAVRAGSLPAPERALYTLAGRAFESREAPGGFMLDGHPAEWRNVARAANAVLMASGAGPIPIPEDGP